MKHLLGKTIGYKCPYCERGDQIVRQNQTTYHYFIGCSAWPKCAFTAELPESLRLKLLGATPLFPLDEEEEKKEEANDFQSRPLTVQEETSAISAHGGRRPCEVHGCENPAGYLATTGGRRHYLCGPHLELQEREAKGNNGPAAQEQ
jgi:ssDNA-binding Zn-finger/Zn-ribbon topoisomerase 1